MKKKMFSVIKIKGGKKSCPICGLDKCLDVKFCEKEIKRIMNEGLGIYE